MAAIQLMCYHLIIINPFSLLSDVLDANGVIVGDEEFDSVMQKYDVENTGRYTSFNSPSPNSRGAY